MDESWINYSLVSAFFNNFDPVQKTGLNDSFTNHTYLDLKFTDYMILHPEMKIL